MFALLVLVFFTIAVIWYVLNNSDVNGYQVKTAQANAFAQQMLYSEQQGMSYCNKNPNLCSSALNTTQNSNSNSNSNSKLPICR